MGKRQQGVPICQKEKANSTHKNIINPWHNSYAQLGLLKACEKPNNKEQYPYSLILYTISYSI